MRSYSLNLTVKGININSVVFSFTLIVMNITINRLYKFLGVVSLLNIMFLIFCVESTI